MWSDSVIALAPDGSGNGSAPLDSYTPEEQAVLGEEDEDLGSAAPTILPTLVGSGKLRHLALQAGKDGKLRLLDLDNLSGKGGPGHLGGALQVIDFPGETRTQPTAATDARDSSTWVFVANDDHLTAFHLEGGVDAPQLVVKWTSDHGGTTPLFASGLLFVAASNRLEARDPSTGTLLFQDGSDGKLGRIHMQSPILENGILYLTDIDTQVHAYSVGGRAPAASTLLVPSVAHSAGANGSFFQTDLTIANTAGAEAVLTFKFLGHDVDGSGGPSVSFLIGAGATETYPDVLKSVFGLEGTFGALQVCSTRPGLTVLAHTYTGAKEGGTYGQMVAGLAPEELSTKASPRSLLAVRDDDAFRTNLILASASSAPLSIDVTALDASGNPLGSRTVTLPPLGMTQISRILQSLGVVSSSSARIVAST
jgi:hypothetical protein